LIVDYDFVDRSFSCEIIRNVMTGNNAEDPDSNRPR
jgi:hypothetical protein